MTTRVGLACALLLSVLAAAMSVAAFMATVRDETVKPGRFVSTRVNSDYAGPPVLFPLDEFYIGYDSALNFRAFYVFPPGHYGHDRGCKVIWDPNAVVDTPDGQAGPGLYVDPCGGARFNRDGALVSGPADRGLDFFRTEPGVDGVIVDTRRLYCGRGLSEAVSATLTPEVTPTAPVATLTATITPPPVVPGEPPSVTPAATDTGTVTPTHSPASSPSATPTPSRCERVSPNSKQR